MVDRRRNLALRTGVATAAAISANTFSRGLLPRSGADQAMITGAVAAYGLGTGTFALSAVEAAAELLATARGSQASWNDPETTTLIAAGTVAAASFGVLHALPNAHSTPIAVATGDSLSRILTTGSAAAALVVGTDKATRGLLGSRGPIVGLGTAAVLGGLAATVRIRAMTKRAARYGEPAPLQAIGLPASAKGWVASVGLGSATTAGLMALAGAEYAIAEGSTRGISRAMGRSDEPVPPLVGHSIAAGAVFTAGAFGLRSVYRRLMHADDIVEPAYPEPPTSERVTAGPLSHVPFDTIGKEGRRFVLMTLTAEAIGAVMGEPALDPIRAIAGYASADTPEERAALALDELETLGAYDKSLIVVAAPTGVGYVNYSFAEAVEYLTRGDCAILVPQYALVPSMLALGKTKAAVRAQTLILQGIRDRIAALPEGHRPRLVQFGESLGAQVALDVAAGGTARFDYLGLDSGLYLGTPFRTRLWQAWFSNEATIDPGQRLGLVSQASEIPLLAPSVRHVQVVHHDDPINKFAYDAFIRQPWWMGPPETRPPGVPKETEFRPFSTFVIALVDLKNGMNSKPGEFVRQGHDYRIELCDAVRFAYGLDASPIQVAAIETALRNREREWAARRMVAKRFSSAKKSVLGTLSKWGVDPETVGFDAETAARLARGEVSSVLPHLQFPSIELPRLDSSHPDA